MRRETRPSSLVLRSLPPCPPRPPRPTSDVAFTTALERDLDRPRSGPVLRRRCQMSARTCSGPAAASLGRSGWPQAAGRAVAAGFGVGAQRLGTPPRRRRSPPRAQTRIATRLATPLPQIPPRLACFRPLEAWRLCTRTDLAAVLRRLAVSWLAPLAARRSPLAGRMPSTMHMPTYTTLCERERSFFSVFACECAARRCALHTPCCAISKRRSALGSRRSALRAARLAPRRASSGSRSS